MRAARLIPLAMALATGACATQHPLAACKGPVWSVNSASPLPAVWDDGESTFFRFPGQMRVPAIYVVEPDGKEAIAPVSMDSNLHIATVHQLAPEFRLRDGNSVLCLVNHHYDPIGHTTGTGTTSPFVERVAR